MAIKIDLLPGYVGLRRTRKWVSWAAALVLAGTAGVLFVQYYRGQQQLAVAQENLDTIKPFAAKATKAGTDATAARNEAAPIITLVGFLTAASRTGAERASLIDLVRRHIYPGAVVSSIIFSDDGKNVEITATVKTPEDYKALLLGLREGSKSNGGVLFAADPKTNMVTGSGVPGFPEGKRPVIPETGENPVLIPFPLAIKINGVLQNPIVIPAEPAGGAAAPAGGDGATPPGGTPPGPPPTPPA